MSQKLTWKTVFLLVGSLNIWHFQAKFCFIFRPGRSIVWGRTSEKYFSSPKFCVEFVKHSEKRQKRRFRFQNDPQSFKNDAKTTKTETYTHAFPKIPFWQECHRKKNVYDILTYNDVRNQFLGIGMGYNAVCEILIF